MKGQLLSVDLLIGILAATAVFSIGVNYFDSINLRQVHTSSAGAASDLILQGQIVAGSCYIQSTFNDVVLVDTCNALDLNTCTNVYTIKRFTAVNLTEDSCASGCILEVKTCEA